LFSNEDLALEKEKIILTFFRAVCFGFEDSLVEKQNFYFAVLVYFALLLTNQQIMR